jgi:hypothetical protein
VQGTISFYNPISCPYSPSRARPEPVEGYLRALQFIVTFQKSCILTLYKKYTIHKFEKVFFMKNIYNLTLLLTLSSSFTLCMQTKLSTINKSFKHKFYCSYILSIELSAQDIQKGRRDAYQKWCPHPINWDNYKAIDTVNKLQLNTHTSTQKNKSDYWKKFTTE